MERDAGSDRPARGHIADGSLVWRALHPFGVEVEGDLRLAPDHRHAFRQLFYSHGLLIARAQQLSLEEQIRVVDALAPVERFADNVGYISTDPDVGHLGEQPLPFHSDLLWTEHPRRVSSLHAVTVSDGASYTEFASGVKAYAELSDALRSEIEDVIGIHVLSDHIVPGRRAIGGELKLANPHARHPVVWTHPVTGERVLLVTETDTVALEGIERERAIELAEALFEVLYRPEALYRHRWHRGDLVIWDNLALQHARGSCAEVGVRTLQLVASQPKPLTELDRRMDLDDPAVKAYYDREFTDTGGDPAP